VSPGAALLANAGINWDTLLYEMQRTRDEQERAQKHMRAKCDEVKRERDALLAQRMECELTLNATRAERDELRTTLSARSDELTDALSAFQCADAERQLMVDFADRSKHMFESLLAEAEDARRLNNELNAGYASAEQRAVVLQLRLDAAEAKHVAAQKACDEAEATAARAAEQMRRERDEATGLRATITRLQDSLDAQLLVEVMLQQRLDAANAANARAAADAVEIARSLDEDVPPPPMEEGQLPPPPLEEEMPLPLLPPPLEFDPPPPELDDAVPAAPAPEPALACAWQPRHGHKAGAKRCAGPVAPVVLRTHATVQLCAAHTCTKRGDGCRLMARAPTGNTCEVCKRTARGKRRLRTRDVQRKQDKRAAAGNEENDTNHSNSSVHDSQ
jgi:hypothetical protein